MEPVNTIALAIGILAVGFAAALELFALSRLVSYLRNRPWQS